VGTGFLSTPFLLQTLAENGYLRTAYKMMENEEAPSWLAMVAQGATTVWEQYECYDNEGRPQAHSFNHYSPGAMCSFLFDTVCGIRVDGENKISIKPKPGGTLTHAKAKVLTAYGEIISGWEKEDNVIKYTFTVPANVTANLILPDGTENTLSAGSHYYRELRMS
jgi:alpha-L-rhamnosidase